MPRFLSPVLVLTVAAAMTLLPAYAQARPVAAQGFAPPEPTIRSAAAYSCVSSMHQAACGPYYYPPITVSDGSNTTVTNGVWDCRAVCGPQSLYVNTPGDWKVTSDQPAGYAKVISYPCNNQQYPGKALSSYTKIKSRFTISMPPAPGLKAEAAYDIWLNDRARELMIWVDDQGQQKGLSYDKLLASNVSISGQSWNVYLYSHNPDNHPEYIVALNGPQEQIGTVHILTSLRWLVRHGYLAASAALGEIEFGTEISSTGGQPYTFTMSGYSLVTSRS
jgi:hypothetical protein